MHKKCPKQYIKVPKSYTKNLIHFVRPPAPPLAYPLNFVINPRRPPPPSVAYPPLRTPTSYPPKVDKLPGFFYPSLIILQKL